MKKLLLYLTNNEEKPREELIKDEIFFDKIFFVVASFTVLFGVPLLWIDGEKGFAVIAVLWYIDFWDNVRHNWD